MVILTVSKYTQRRRSKVVRKKVVDAFCKISHLVHRRSPLEVQGDDKSERQFDPAKTKEEKRVSSVLLNHLWGFSPLEEDLIPIEGLTTARPSFLPAT